MYEILCRCAFDIPGVKEGDLPAHSHRVHQIWECLEEGHPTVAVGETIEFKMGSALRQDEYSRARWKEVLQEDIIMFWVDWKQVARELMREQAR